MSEKPFGIEHFTLTLSFKGEGLIQQVGYAH